MSVIKNDYLQPNNTCVEEKLKCKKVIIEYKKTGISKR